MYAYKELKQQLEGVNEFRFIFTSPTFVKEKAAKQKRAFYIPRFDRKHSLYGTEFEVKLRNEMTQKAIARECAEWIRKKATFKSNTSGENMSGFLTIDCKRSIIDRNKSNRQFSTLKCSKRRSRHTSQKRYTCLSGAEVSPTETILTQISGSVAEEVLNNIY